MGHRAWFHKNHRRDTGCVRRWHAEGSAVSDRGGGVGPDGGPRGETAIRIEEIRRLVNLDMVLEHALLGVPAGKRDGTIRQEQLHVVVEPREYVRSGGRERVSGWIINLGLQAGRACVFILRGAAVDQDLAVGKDCALHLHPCLRHLWSLYPTRSIDRTIGRYLSARRS